MTELEAADVILFSVAMDEIASVNTSPSLDGRIVIVGVRTHRVITWEKNGLIGLNELVLPNHSPIEVIDSMSVKGSIKV